VRFYDKKELRMNTSINSFIMRSMHFLKTQRTRTAHALLVAFFVLTTCFASSVALCIADAMKACPSCAYAATSLALSATTQPSYENPYNGVIEDSGGVRARALGESMVNSTVDKQAFFERDTDGHCFVTLRLHQGKEIGDVKFQSSKDDKGAFSEAIAAQTMQKNAKANTIDVRAQVSSQDAALRVSMYVEPMGRYVIYFVKLAQFEPGNAGGFVESVKPGEGSDDTTAAATTNTSTAQGSSSDAAATQKSSSSAGSSTSATSGVKEFNGDGAPVGSDTKAAANSLNYPLIIGIIVVALIVIALIVNFAILAPARKRALEAACAASSKATRVASTTPASSSSVAAATVSNAAPASATAPSSATDDSDHADTSQHS
jgi:hypothetical protein